MTEADPINLKYQALCAEFADIGFKIRDHKARQDVIEAEIQGLKKIRAHQIEQAKQAELAETESKKLQAVTEPSQDGS